MLKSLVSCRHVKRCENVGKIVNVLTMFWQTMRRKSMTDAVGGR